MTVTIATMATMATVNGTVVCHEMDSMDPTKRHSRYATNIYTGSPLNDIQEKSVEVEVEMDSYTQKFSGAAKQIKSPKEIKSPKQKKPDFKPRSSINDINKKKIRFKPRNSTFSRKETKDSLQEPLTPQNVDEGMIDIKPYDLDEDADHDDLKSISYGMSPKNTTLHMQRSSSLRSLGNKEVEKFKQLAAYHESLVEDVPLSDDIMTPQSPHWE